MPKLTQGDIRRRARTPSADIDQDALVTGAVRVFKIWVNAGADAATVFINDALTKSGGGTTLTVGAAIGGHGVLDFGEAGILFSTGLSIDNSGTTPTGGVLYIAE